jgi:hypothetical protein
MRTIYSVVFLMCMSLHFQSIAQAEPDPAADWFKDDNEISKSIWCDDKRSLRAMRASQIVSINLSVEDFIYGSRDTLALGINVDHKTDIHNEFRVSFDHSVRKYNKDKEFRGHIWDEFSKYRNTCIQDDGGYLSADIKKCEAKTTAFISAKYGTGLIALRCDVEIKGRRYPILAYSECMINTSAELGGYGWPSYPQITEISAFEESSVSDGVKRLLDQHARNISRYFSGLKHLCEGSN